MNDITVTTSLLPIREFGGQRVVTFKDIDSVHNRPEGTAKRNFNTNRQYFIEGEDYFRVKCGEVSTFFVPTPNGFDPNADLILVTLTGYLMLVKSFKDDLSWTVQRMLVKSYFKLKELCQPALSAEEYRQLEERVQRLESQIEGGANLVKPQKIDTNRDQANADYVLNRLLQQPKTVLRKRELLRICSKLKADAVTAAITILYNADIVRYTVIRQPKGRPIEMIELVK